MTTLIEHIESLEKYLTSTEKNDLLHGLKNLNKYLTTISRSSLSQKEISFLLKFYSEKFNVTDPVFIEELIEGIFNLTKYDQEILPQNVNDLFKHIFEQLNIQSLPKKCRNNIIKLLHHFILIDTHIQYLAKDDDFVLGFIQNIAQETSPGNLLLIFEMISQLLSFLANDTFIEEIFENISIYFPIDYDESTSQVTRPELSKRLLMCLFASRILAGNLVIPVLVEKCISDWGQARVDAFEALGVCISGELPKSLSQELSHLSNNVLSNTLPINKQIFMANKFSILNTVANISSDEENEYDAFILRSCLKALKKMEASGREFEDFIVSMFNIIYPIKDTDKPEKNIECIGSVVELFDHSMMEIFAREVEKRKIQDFIQKMLAFPLEDLNSLFNFLEENQRELGFVSKVAQVFAKFFHDKEEMLKILLTIIPPELVQEKSLEHLNCIYSGINSSFEVDSKLESKFIETSIFLHILNNSEEQDPAWCRFFDIFTSKCLLKRNLLKIALGKIIGNLITVKSNFCVPLIGTLRNEDVNGEFVIEILVSSLMDDLIARDKLRNMTQIIFESFKNNQLVSSKFGEFFTKLESVICQKICTESVISLKNSMLINVLSEILYEKTYKIQEFIMLSPEILSSVHRISALVFSQLESTEGPTFPDKSPSSTVLKLGFIYGNSLHQVPFENIEFLLEDKNINFGCILPLTYQAYMEKFLLKSNDLKNFIISPENELKKISSTIYILNHSCGQDIHKLADEHLFPRSDEALEKIYEKISFFKKYENVFFPIIPRRLLHMKEGLFYHQALFESILRPLIDCQGFNSNPQMLEFFMDFSCRIARLSNSVLKDTTILKVCITVLKLNATLSQSVLFNAFELIKLFSKMGGTKLDIDDLDLDDILRQMISHLSNHTDPKLTLEILILLFEFVNTKVFPRYERQIINCLDSKLESRYRMIRFKAASLKNHIFTLN